MATTFVRQVLRVVHRWIGVAFVIVLAPVAVSGALLVFDQEIDSLVHPERYAITGPTAAWSPSDYLARAGVVLEAGLQPTAIRFPEDGLPVTVTARGATRPEGGPPRLVTVYLDPPTGRVLDRVDVRSSLISFLHRFHENLTIPEYSGRAVVGWVGAGMFALCMTGIVLWWPRSGALVAGLRWRRAPAATTNLHHLFGFWIAVPLAIVSVTGIYLAFPPQARSLMSSIAPMNPQGQRPGFAPLARQTALSADSALDAARTAEPHARPTAVFFPIAPRDAAGQAAPPLWRVQLRKHDGDAVTLFVNDRSADVTRAPEPLRGDRAAQWIRWIHEGSHSGVIWKSIVFLTGVFPAILGMTGVIMWLRGRRNRQAVASRDATPGVLQAAE